MTAVEVHPEAIDALLAAPTSPLGRFLLDFAIRVQTQARRNCPVDTGRLRASIGVDLVGTGAGLQATVGSNVVYARFVHDGTRYLRGRPYLADALVSVARGG